MLNGTWLINSGQGSKGSNVGSQAGRPISRAVGHCILRTFSLGENATACNEEGMAASFLEPLEAFPAVVPELPKVPMCTKRAKLYDFGRDVIAGSSNADCTSRVHNGHCRTTLVTGNRKSWITSPNMTPCRKHSPSRWYSGPSSPCPTLLSISGISQPSMSAILSPG